MIENRRRIIARSELAHAAPSADSIEKILGPDVLRWFVVAATRDDLTIEATYFRDRDRASRPRPGPAHSGAGKSAVISIIPTGIGCEIGGYAGDAGPASALLAKTADYLVTNPNAVNASNFINIPDNLLYTEGLCIDLFSRGQTRLQPTRGNRIGVVVEAAPRRQLELTFNVINTIRAVHGVDIIDVVVTPQPIGTRCVRNESGAYVGTLDAPDVLFEACQLLVERGATAIAVTSNPQDLPTDDYAAHFAGKHPNPVGGVEAIVSHLVVKRFGLPAAHAPMLTPTGERHELEGGCQIPFVSGIVDPRGAGEIASSSGLACILIGLRNAPQLQGMSTIPTTDELGIENVLAVIAPASALGGIPVISAMERHIPVIAVRDNGSILGVDAEALGFGGVHQASSYMEAAGIVLAIRHGISVASIRRPLAPFVPVEATPRVASAARRRFPSASELDLEVPLQPRRLPRAI